MKLFPSLISAPLLYLHSAVEAIDPYVDGYHIDIMDNHFVPNLTWGSSFVHALSTATQKPLWLHLMVDSPAQMIAQCFAHKGNYIITVHQETVHNWNKLLELPKKQNVVLGIALNPATDVETIKPYIKEIDHLLIMSVEPGRCGQQFLPSSWEKIEKARAICTAEKNEHFAQNKMCTLAIDGGVTKNHIQPLTQAGITMVATASAIFGAQLNYTEKTKHSTAIQKENLNTYLDQCIANVIALKKQA